MATRKELRPEDIDVSELSPEDERIVREALESALADTRSMRRTLAATGGGRVDPEDDSPLFDAPGGTATFFSRIAGVSHGNRQSLLAGARPGERLQLTPEPDNAVDPFAIKLCLPDGSQLGYVPSDLAREFSGKLARGLRIEAMLMQITGGTKRKPTMGGGTTKRCGNRRKAA
jgi:hypothetical protein